MEASAGVVSSACAVRFALLVWHGYRHGKVKSAVPGGGYYDRQANPIVYWIFMGAHTIVLAVCLGILVYIAFDLMRSPR